MKGSRSVLMRVFAGLYSRGLVVVSDINVYGLLSGVVCHSSCAASVLS